MMNYFQHLLYSVLGIVVGKKCYIISVSINNMLKIQILLMYYDRPNIVKNALNSIKEMNYDNWELVFLDDGSVTSGESIVKDILKDSLHKVRFFNTNDI